MAQGGAGKIPDGAYATAAESIERGESDAAVEQKLVAMGVSLDVAKRIVAEQHRASEIVQKSDGRTEMRFGAVVFGIGILVRLAGSGGFGGILAMIVGAATFLRGWWKQRKSRRVA